jgi:hypothetical protein
MTNDRTPPPELQWEDALQKLYRRKSDERKGETNTIQEGDPRQFKAAAAELTAKAQSENPIDSSSNSPNNKAGETAIETFTTNDNPRLIINCWDELLPQAFVEQEIIPNATETLKAEAILGKVLWDILQQFGPDEAYIFLALIAQAGESPTPWQTPFQIQSSDLIDHLGWQRNSENPLEQFAHLIQLIDRICHLTIQLFQTKMEDKSTHQHTAHQATSPFWCLIGTNYISRLGRTSSSRTSGGSYRSAYPKELEFQITPGQWLTPFLQHNPSQLDSLIEFSRIAKGILRINPTRKKLASRLAIFLTAIEPLHQSATYRVRDLLSQIEADRPLTHHYKTDETQTRLLVRWNNALRRLKLLEWVIEFDDETYPNALRPIGSLDDDDETETIPGRFDNWFKTWLDGRLILRSSPADIRIEDIRLGDRAIGSKISRTRRTRPSTPQTTAPITGITLDVALTLKGWSKAQLSAQLHMDRSMITHWIKGSRPISIDQRKRLWKILSKELLAAQKIRY